MPVDYSKYPDNWLSEIRPRILKRANYCCELEGCGLKNKQEVFSIKNLYTKKRDWYESLKQMEAVEKCYSELPEGHKYNSDYKLVKVVLTIAHLDHDETNMNVTDDRLMAMCQKCHLQYDAEEKKRRKLLKKD
jgi:hypothetical protein